MVTCPHCQQPAMSRLRKLFLRPAIAVACKSCGKKVSMHWASMLILAPVLLGFLLSGGFLRQQSLAIHVTVVAVVVLVSVAISMLWVPLVKREP